MSYNGYNYSHYFNQPTSQNHVRQESQANHQRIPGSSSHVAPSHHQQQAGIQNYSATQSNDRQQPLPQASPEQWYMSGNMASSGGHSGSTPATSSPAPQSQYINGMAGRKRRSHIDTSALGSLAYASGLESSGADSQLLQMDRRNPSDHAINQRGIQTPPAHLVSPMHGNSTSALNNNQGHVRSDSLASSHSQSISISRDSQRQTASGYDNPSVASPNYEHHRHRQAGPTISSDASSHHRGYSGAFTSNTGRALSHNEVPNSQIPPQQAQSLPSEHRTSPPSGSQQTISGVQLEIPQRQVSSAHRNQGPKVPELNTLNSRLSPGDKSQRTQIHGPLADKNARLDPALRKNQITPKSDTQINGPLNGSGHIPYQLHPQSTSHTNDSQGARNLTTQMDQLREGQLPQGQTQRIAQLHPPNNIAYHDQHHYSPAVHSTAPITIDPSRVFNPYHQEYQRRKALAEAQEPENATQVNPRLHHGSDEALSGPLAPAEQRATSRVSVGAKSPILSDQERTGGQNKGSMISTLESVAAPGDGDANVGTNGSSSGDKVQMEAEMRLMLDKMREYKSKDPSLFLQIWEQVKKVC